MSAAIDNSSNADATTLQVVRDSVKYELHIDSIADDANLFGLGASSIELVRLINRLEDALGVRLEFEDVVGTPSVAELALILDRSRQRSAPSGATSACAAPPDSTSPASALRDLTGVARYPLAPVDSIPTVLRTTRVFAARQVSFPELAQLLSWVRIQQCDDSLHAAYASAGACFPVQVYLYAKSGRVTGIPGGLYYYHPLAHELRSLAPQLVIDALVYEPLLNAPMFAGAAFAIYLLYRPSAIEPSYGARARDYALIEAGSIAQRLREGAGALDIGLAAIGELRFDAIRHWFQVEPDQQMLCSFLGGPRSASEPAPADDDPASALSALRIR
jgi:SagB-type dehydrogenase family enzyme